VRAATWERLGLERSGDGLGALQGALDGWAEPPDFAPADRASAETRNLVDVARAMAGSALFRQESRGAHFRSDFPDRDDQRFLGHTLWEGGAARLVDVRQPLQVGV